MIVRFGITMVCAVLLILSSACTAVPRARTLPPSIRTVYVPIAVNRTAEPAIEERFTQFLQEEILADGRLQLTQRKKADAFIEVEFTRLDRSANGFGDNDFGTDIQGRLEARIAIIQNVPGRPKIGGYRPIRGVASQNTDTRATTFEPEPDFIDKLLLDLARDAMIEIMTGEYRDDAGIVPKVDTGTATGAAAAPGA